MTPADERAARAHAARIDALTLDLATALDALADTDPDDEGARAAAMYRVAGVFDVLREQEGPAAIARLLPTAPAWRARAVALRRMVAFFQAVEQGAPAAVREALRAELRANHALETRLATSSKQYFPTPEQAKTSPLLAACAAAKMTESEVIAKLHEENTWLSITLRCTKLHQPPKPMIVFVDDEGSGS